MSSFYYTAFDQEGRVGNGEVEAATQAEAFAKLRDRGAFPISLSERPKGSRRFWEWANSDLRRFTRKQKLTYVEQLAGYLAGGLTIDKTHAILAESTAAKPFAKACNNINEHLAAGQGLASAWQKAGGFTGTDIAVVEVAERTGQLVPMLQQLAVDLRRQQDIVEKLTSAAVYPIFLVLMAVASLVLIGLVVVPALEPLFEANPDARPYLVIFFMATKSMVTEHSLLVTGGTACAAALAWSFSASGTFRLLVSQLLRRLPQVRRHRQSRLARNLGLALTCGVPLQSAVRLVRDGSTDDLQRRDLSDLESKLAEGRRMSSVVADLKLFENGDLELLSMGEAGGQLSQSLMTIADRSEHGVQRSVDRLMTLLTPVLTLLMGLLIGGLMLSVMQSILSVNNLASQ